MDWYDFIWRLFFGLLALVCIAALLKDYYGRKARVFRIMCNKLRRERDWLANELVCGHNYCVHTGSFRSDKADWLIAAEAATKEDHDGTR